jgi:histidinol-phosphate/aromatic aminotransferase/cobyric acid decarboxylase-like protein
METRLSQGNLRGQNVPLGSYHSRPLERFGKACTRQGFLLDAETIEIDEAYVHFSEEEKCSPLVAADKDVIILRTFSKLYGLAGLRAGAALGRPDLLAKIQSYGAGALPVAGIVGAMASLRAKTLVAERRKNMRAIREDVFAFLRKNRIDFVPSDSNCFMLNTRSPANEYIQAMRAEKVYVGRVWPVWPTYCRITIGTAAEMAKFKQATLKVLS